MLPIVLAVIGVIIAFTYEMRYMVDGGPWPFALALMLGGAGWLLGERIEARRRGRSVRARRTRRRT